MNELKETIITYNNDVDRYIEKLEFPTPVEDLNEFMSLLIGKKVLDAGCGAGRDTKYFFNNGCSVIGVDSSKNMLDAARKRTKANFLLRDIRDTEFEKPSFNGIWCYNTLLHLNEEDLCSTLNEFYQLLEEEGILFIATMEGEGKVVKESEKGKKHFYLYTEDYMKNKFEELNFGLVKVKHYKGNEENFIVFIVKK